MAKRQKTKAFSFQGFDAEHYKTTDAYARAVGNLFNRATNDIAAGVANLNIDPNKPFQFSDYPTAQATMKRVANKLAKGITTVISDGSRKQWLYACQKNDEFIASIMDTSKLSKARLSKMQDRNLDAFQTFQQRKVDGMNLSQRVWKYTNQFRAQIEAGIDVGLGEGRSAQQLSRDLRQNLNDPNRLFRRVRDKRGNLQLSRSAKAFHPGIGVYRSSAKNAARLTRSEINMAYREADWLRWQQLDFVVGFEIHRSNREPQCKCPLCARLVGNYPKWFKFKGWHPQCMCYATPILADDEDFNAQELADLKSALHGTEYKKLTAKNQVNDVPDAFKEWVEENVDAQKNWGSTPYFVKDNFKGGLLSNGLNQGFVVAPAIIKTEPIIEPIQNTPLDDVIVKLDNNKVEYNEVAKLNKPLTDEDIISKVGGGDLTKGSCASLGFAYAANKLGFDVLDFRGGKSRGIFSRSSTLNEIAQKVGGVVVSHTNDFTKATMLLKQVQVGKEYYFSCGAHVAIVRKTTTGFEYLELQSATNNGWKPLTTEGLKNRFGAKKTHTTYGAKYETKECLIDIDLFKSDAHFWKMLGYINTQESNQLKGVKGSIK